MVDAVTTAAEVKDALRRRHPAIGINGGPGEWTCLEEYMNIDLLAVSAWSGSKRIGYEVKVSRSDYRRELLKPSKRVRSVAWCDEFYFAVPHDLLTAVEVAYDEPEWEGKDFVRIPCPNAHLSFHRRYRKPRCVERVPTPTVLSYDWQKYGNSSDVYNAGWTEIPCSTCGGTGIVGKSRVEEEAPTLWVPRDVGLAVITSRGVSIAKKAPSKPKPKDHEVRLERQMLAHAIRHASFRPDLRHIEYRESFVRQMLRLELATDSVRSPS